MFCVQTQFWFSSCILFIASVVSLCGPLSVNTRSRGSPWKAFCRSINVRYLSCYCLFSLSMIYRIMNIWSCMLYLLLKPFCNFHSCGSIIPLSLLYFMKIINDENLFCSTPDIMLYIIDNEISETIMPMIYK